MDSFDELIRDIRKYEDRKMLVKELRTEMRKPVPSVRNAIRRRALSTLPHRGGLNTWVSKIRFKVNIKLSGRSVGVSMQGGRNSTGGRSDMRRINSGKVRHPSWGRRGPGQWHSQPVIPGFFTEPAEEVDQWKKACVAAVDKALEVIRRG